MENAPDRIFVDTDTRHGPMTAYQHIGSWPGVRVEYLRADIIDKDNLRDLVENYLPRSGVGESYFGVLACGNSNFVKRLRAGKNFYAETILRVREYIADNPAP